MNKIIVAFPAARTTRFHLRGIRTLIAESKSDDERQRNLRADQCRALQQTAIQQFSELNMWRRCPDGFRLEDIGTKRVSDFQSWRYGADIARAFDQALFFKKLGRCAAVAVQPNHCRAEALTELDDLARRHGVALHRPPHLTASIHFPGETAFLVFTGPDVVVKWLPEQIVGIKGDAT